MVLRKNTFLFSCSVTMFMIWQLATINYKDISHVLKGLKALSVLLTKITILCF